MVVDEYEWHILHALPCVKGQIYLVMYSELNKQVTNATPTPHRQNPHMIIQFQMQVNKSPESLFLGKSWQTCPYLSLNGLVPVLINEFCSSSAVN